MMVAGSETTPIGSAGGAATSAIHERSMATRNNRFVQVTNAKLAQMVLIFIHFPERFASVAIIFYEGWREFRAYWDPKFNCRRTEIIGQP
ncbi:MAG: hypothetical protein PHZ23_15110 [Acidiphilium sp.]|nr:hypothetical protein [Acidiphilium sp.]